jgi:ubiquitin-conjugating enzyme E2 variant
MAKIEQRDAQELGAGYSRYHRIYELGGIGVTSCTLVWLCVRIAHAPSLSGWWVPLALLLGLLFADLTSGVAHWGFDTWGSVDTPVVGRLAIRTFRHHHVDPKAITRHDFVETNGHNFALALLPAGIGVWYVEPTTATLSDVFVGMSLASGAVFVALTSQIHKWAHMDTPPRVIQLLQRTSLLLSPEHHAAHHAAPYTRAYCITVGWLNGPLRAFRIFEGLERLITACTGAIPREDDIGKAAAEAVARAAAERDALREPPQITPPARAPGSDRS